MAIFQIINKKTKKIDKINIKRERDIQELFENNLENLLDIYFLASEYSTSFGGRIDTLGVDKNGSPVIIEYKKNQNDNVINQGLSYLKWLLDHKADFEKLIIDKLPKIYNKKFIDWDSPRVICIAESYNKFDLDTVEILPIKVELYKFVLYSNNTLKIELETQKKVNVKTSNIFKKEKKQQSNSELQKNYTIEEHLKKADENIKSLFFELKEKIISLDSEISEEAKAKYIAYKLNTNITDISVYKNCLKIYLNIVSGKLNDPNNLARDLAKPKKIGHWGNGDYEVKISKKEDIDNIMELIKQSYNYNK